MRYFRNKNGNSQALSCHKRSQQDYINILAVFMHFCSSLCFELLHQPSLEVGTVRCFMWLRYRVHFLRHLSRLSNVFMNFWSIIWCWCLTKHEIRLDYQFFRLCYQFNSTAFFGTESFGSYKHASSRTQSTIVSSSEKDYF